MSIFHHHKWLEVERFYVSPKGKMEAERISSDFLQQILLGQTTIVYQCEGCGKKKTEIYLGESNKKEEE